MKAGDALLWRLELNSTETDKGPKFSYLFGTMHSSNSCAIDKVSGIQDYIRQCTHYYGETDLDSALFSQNHVKDIKEWKGLKVNLNPSAYRKIRHLLMTISGIDLDHIQTMPPLIQQTYISESLMMNRSSQPPLDMIMWNYARQLNLILGGVESAEEQERIYRQIPLKFQKKQLKDAVLHITSTIRYLTKLTNAYNKEDLTRLYKLSKPSLGPVKSLLLTNRNKLMADRIFDILNREQTSFIALGAAHLPGLKGILRLLKLKGVRLKSFNIYCPTSS
jgi:uncharacterized protein